jgi:hypothetical protein
MSDSTFDFNLFIKESKEVLLNPKTYFAALKTSGGMSEPLIKAVVYGALSGAISFLWSLLHIGTTSYGMFGGGAIGVMTFIWSVIGAIIGLFIGSVILLVISSICKGNTDFEANMRVTATLMVMMPISAFFSFAGYFNIYLGVIVSLAIGAYSLWLLYIALIETLKANPETSKIVTYVLIALLVVFTLAGIGVKKRADRFMDEFSNKDLNELLKDTEDEE